MPLCHTVQVAGPPGREVGPFLSRLLPRKSSGDSAPSRRCFPTIPPLGTSLVKEVTSSEIRHPVGKGCRVGGCCRGRSRFGRGGHRGGCVSGGGPRAAGESGLRFSFSDTSRLAGNRGSAESSAKSGSGFEGADSSSSLLDQERPLPRFSWHFPPLQGQFIRPLDCILENEVRLAVWWRSHGCGGRSFAFAQGL